MSGGGGFLLRLRGGSCLAITICAFFWGTGCSRVLMLGFTWPSPSSSSSSEEDEEEQEDEESEEDEDDPDEELLDFCGSGRFS